ncbi:hypothetical protein [Mycolicibacterium thermoresistibile]|jgi:hypothetical protein|uniref:Uncharacterized protein n=2 Tax=Mycolicibacterium thermoresistibile TaxID=1797 RepID=G7CKY9_MYCT3|nr:hypothetical protein [Mycolicibacterium thermoresistibile]EHI11796.1 hypothetical protein KEK_12893 [Mycolicibacterium thermoresistibile ATCC 19527]MCV7189883.1 hypothetical protein [Mycolicibacterium thermoresistibile]GAT17613.1 putative uncharacterized protein [Mycolicibacterium thermoresistibile]SNW19587.1 Uncharacterised protein [Mycolicibacterium thermoresistibile]
MTVFEWFTAALAAALVLATFLGFFIGLLGWLGGVYIVRCSGCHHLTLSSERDPRPSCVHCRHPMLTHPLYSVRHPHQKPIVDDPLRY